MYGDQDQATMEAAISKSTLDSRTMAALLLKLPLSKDPIINKMIRLSRVYTAAEQLAIEQLANAGSQKDLFQTVARTVAMAQQIEQQLERLVISSDH